MTIAILPARLANQIAAGEVVERPASVIKELVENSLDAGATTINVEVDKGGVKRIRINDNGIGIEKDELTLALSRHATSKIKDLKDLEAINSLGFRGEALASISSVSRLTLTSKPKNQATAWQASAEGRDMAVSIKPAAHPDGTTIEVLDLFFNTPARRKFLRTEKTEFNHIDEVIKRIALACFDVNFSLTHNGKIVRQYRAATTKAQMAKRVAMVCGQKFIDSAIEINCQHDDMQFTGWLAKPSCARNQNDLCYSYVNGRMMRDKLINHAIRQAYGDLLPSDTYPAFVLFLSLDHREVDVNVHPAKHEVRFHQSRYVHDFIYSVCHKALLENNQIPDVDEQVNQLQSEHSSAASLDRQNVHYAQPDYIKPLTQVKQQQISHTSTNYINEKAVHNNFAQAHFTTRQPTSRSAADNYQKLMTPFSDPITEQEIQLLSTASDHDHDHDQNTFFVASEQGKYGIFKYQNVLYLMALDLLAFKVNQHNVNIAWQSNNDQLAQCLISQPLLLPVVITLSSPQLQLVENYQDLLAKAGIIVQLNNTNRNKAKVQIRQFPALLRDQDVSKSFITIVDELLAIISTERASKQFEQSDENSVKLAIAKAMTPQKFNDEQAYALWLIAEKTLGKKIIELILLNSVMLDLTSSIEQLKTKTEHASPGDKFSHKQAPT